MTGVGSAIIGTLVFGLLGVVSLHRMRTGQSWFGTTPALLVRLSAGLGLAFSVLALITIWWVTIVRPS